jgi:6-phosphogluconolactonase (cycloisomerase 2 family)
VPFKGGQTITGRAADLGFDVSAGTLMEFGGTGNIDNANVLSIDAVANAEYTLIERTGAGTTGQTNLVKSWDNAGSITVLGSGTFVAHRVYRFSNGTFVIQYGQGNYANIVLARAGLLIEDYVLNDRLNNATFFGWWILGETATNTGGTTLTEFREYTIGVQGGSSSGLAGCLLKGNNLSDLLDVSAARTNLGLGTVATTAASTYATAAQGTLADNAAPLASPTFTGTPAAPTATIGTDTTQVATTAFVLANGASGLVGDLTFTARSTIPTGFLRTDGAVYLQSAYPDLFAVVGFIVDYDEATKLADPATLPTNQGNGVAFGADGVYMSVAHSSSPYVTIYKRSGDTFTKLADPGTLPTGTAYGTAFSADGIYLSVSHFTSPFVTIYKRAGDTFTKLTNPATLPTNDAFGTDFSADGIYLSVAHEASPFVTIYKRSGDAFTKLTNPATLPPDNGRGTAFSADGIYMSVAHEASPFVTVYKRAGDTFTKLTNPATLPTNTTNGTAFSPDGVYMSVVQFASPYVNIYKRAGDVFTKLADPATLPTGTGNDTAFSADGVYLSVSHTTSPYVTIYKRAGDTFTKLTNPATLPTGTGNGTAFSADGVYMSVPHATSPYVTIYKSAAYDTATEFAVPTITDANSNVVIKAE